MAPHVSLSSSSSTATLGSLLLHFNLPPTCRNTQELRAAYFRLAMHLHPDKNNGEGTQFKELQQRYLQCLSLLEKEEKQLFQQSSPRESSPSHPQQHRPHFSYRHEGAEDAEGAHARDRSGRAFHQQGRGHAAAYGRPYKMRSAGSPESFYTWRAGAGGGGFSSFNHFRPPFDGNHQGPSATRFARSPYTHSWHHSSQSRQASTGGDMGSWGEPPPSASQGLSPPITGLSSAVLFLLGSGCLVSVLGLMSSSFHRRRFGKSKDEDFFLPHYLQQLSPLPQGSTGRQEDQILEELFFLDESGGEVQEDQEAREKRTDERMASVEMSGWRGSEDPAQLCADLGPVRASFKKISRETGQQANRRQTEEAGLLTSLPAQTEDWGAGGPGALRLSHGGDDADGRRTRGELLKIEEDPVFYEGVEMAPGGSPSFTTESASSEGSRLEKSGQESHQREDCKDLKATAYKRKGRKTRLDKAMTGGGGRGGGSGCDLLTTQYHRGTIRRRGRGGKREELPVREKLEGADVEGGQGTRANRARASPSMFVPGPTPVDLTRGHRGVHRESRFISGYGGMTGVGFDEFLAAAELKESQSRSGREEAQGTPVPRSLEDSH